MAGYHIIQNIIKMDTDGKLKSKVYSEHSRISTMELFCENSKLFTIFAKKLHRRCSTGFLMRLCKDKSHFY